MGPVATLAELVQRLPELDSTHTIFVAPPWSRTSPALVDYEPDEGGLPEGAADAGLAYFLEVDIAREVVDDWRAYRKGEVSDLELCNRLISYAINDA